LDTNVLIGLFSEKGEKRKDLRKLLLDYHEFSISAFVWHEFVTGPLSDAQKLYGLSLVEERIVPMDKDIAELGAKLYNETGRRRGSRPDCLVAATAIVKESFLFTYNKDDFSLFKSFGLLVI